MKNIPIKTIQKAAKFFLDKKIRGVLVGTVGLQLLGYNIVGNDLDFLVEQLPFESKELTYQNEGDAESAGCRTEIDGVNVDYIDVVPGDKRSPYFTKDPVWICGVPVATMVDIIGLKRQADRSKDRAFLRGWDASIRIISNSYISNES